MALLYLVLILLTVYVNINQKLDNSFKLGYDGVLVLFIILSILFMVF